MPPGPARRAVDVEDLLVRVKNGAGPELGAVAREVAALAGEGRLGEDEEGGVLVPALLARLAGVGDAGVRAILMAALRRLAGCAGAETKMTRMKLRALILSSSSPSSRRWRPFTSMFKSPGSR